MNIKQAKEEIKHTVEAYLKKDELGEYRIPEVRQRPMLLMGPPGIGKTQIMEQIARECKIGLVAYTITHHTRQSAVGLPFIKEKNFDGKTCSVTEYTMSEIIASVYQKMEDTGLREGILFIDEINCVSETLAPTMLQFLQCKTFGNQKVPKGWIIVAAGNPPEYNKSVREFDMVTLDRVRCMNIEADLSVWKEYAKSQQIQASILSYLEIRPKNFYRVEADVDGLSFVTARGWEDLSNLCEVYKELNLPVTQEVIYEFLRHQDVAEDVAAYFDLYQKYQDDYGIPEILAGRIRPEIFERIYQAAFDERLSVVNLLLDGLRKSFLKTANQRYLTDGWFEFLQEYRRKLDQKTDPVSAYQTLLLEKKQEVEQVEAEGFYTRRQLGIQRKLLQYLKECEHGLGQVMVQSSEEMEKEVQKQRVFQMAKQGFDVQTEQLEKLEEETRLQLEHAFDFMEHAFDKGEEMVVFVTELSVSSESAAFLAEHTCERYLTYNQQLLIGSRRAELLSELRR